MNRIIFAMNLKPIAAIYNVAFYLIPIPSITYTLWTLGLSRHYTINFGISKNCFWYNYKNRRPLIRNYAIGILASSSSSIK